jgi:hypothetical protein
MLVLILAGIVIELLAGPAVKMLFEKLKTGVMFVVALPVFKAPVRALYVGDGTVRLKEFVPLEVMLAMPAVEVIEVKGTSMTKFSPLLGVVIAAPLPTMVGTDAAVVTTE